MVVILAAKGMKKKESGQNKKTTSQKKMTIGETRQALAKAEAELERYKDLAWCHMCGTFRAKVQFHKDTDPRSKTQVCPICKRCAYDLAMRKDENGDYHSPTKESLQLALFYLNKPYKQVVYDASIRESENEITGKTKNNVYTAYIKNIAMPQYEMLGWKDSDMFKSKIVYDDEKVPDDFIKQLSADAKDTYVINKKTTIRFLGYDPFENEPIEEQPILYAKLVNYFDESVREDGLKLEAVIEIVQSFKDVKTINDAITQYKIQIGNNPSVISTIKSLADTKQKMISSALALAKDNGISVNYNNSKSKGAGTLSGILKEMSEMDLDDVEINTFNYETEQAISQIMEKNFENQMKQLNPDENDWEKEVFHQAKLIHILQKERDNAVEYCRLLRKENKDLKNFLQERNIIDEALQVIDE